MESGRAATRAAGGRMNRTGVPVSGTGARALGAGVHGVSTGVRFVNPNFRLKCPVVDADGTCVHLFRAVARCTRMAAWF